MLAEPTIDRLAPTRRPDGRPVGFQKWRDLLFLHWIVEPGILRALLPNDLEVDTYDGQAYVGVVPFAMQDVRPLRWWPTAVAFRFLECNVRTYVVHNGRPGVYFFSLDAASRLAVWTARAGWSLPYYFARMGLSRQDDECEYDTSRVGSDVRHHVRYRVAEELGVSAPGTLQHFLLERYLLFVKRKQTIHVGQVHHSPYPVQRVELLQCHDELIATAGIAGVAETPALRHYSPGVNVEIFRLKPAGKADLA